LNTRQIDSDLWMTYAMRQQLEPYNNVMNRVETAGSQDRTRVSPLLTSLGWAGYDPRDVTQILPLLRHAAVSRILSFDPIEHPDLRLRATVPVAITGLAIHVYELKRPWPRVLVACRAHWASTRLGAARAPHAATWDPYRDVAFEDPDALRAAACNTGRARTVSLLPDEEHYESESDGPGWLLVRSTHARGWHATVDGRRRSCVQTGAIGRLPSPPVGTRSRFVMSRRGCGPGWRSLFSLSRLSFGSSYRGENKWAQTEAFLTVEVRSRIIGPCHAGVGQTPRFRRRPASKRCLCAISRTQRR
jgi:hypothetical protein